MHLLDLSPEIQHEILKLCPPGDLASLCRSHTSVQDAAERVLYRHVYFFALPPRNLIPIPHQESNLPPALEENRTLLHTLSTNGRKAGMVRSFYIELDIRSSRHGADDAVINSILAELHSSLQSLPNLVDLRIIYHWWGDPSNGRISQVIRFAFNLIPSGYVNEIQSQGRSLSAPHSMARTRSRSGRNDR